MNTFRTLLAASLLSTGVAVGQTAAAPASPASPTVPQAHFLRVVKEWIKPGQISAVAQLDAERAKLMRATNWKQPVIGFRSLTGPDQLIYLSFYNDLGPLQTERETIDANPALKAKLEKIDRDAGTLMTGKEDFVTVFHEDVTYRPNWNWSKTRCIDMLRLHLNAGKGGEYVENRKLTLESHERGALDTHIFLYSVISGTPSWTWFIIRPMQNMDHLDMLRHQGFGEPMNDEEKKRQVELFAQAAASEEEEYFCADPSISYVPTSWSGDDSSFWNGGK